MTIKRQCFSEPCYRRNTNRERADEQLERLKDQLLLQQFLQECDEVSSVQATLRRFVNMLLHKLILQQVKIEANLKFKTFAGGNVEITKR